ncbi:MAG: DUF2059 domain-containing protein [Acidobacteriota bacterium]
MKRSGLVSAFALDLGPAALLVTLCLLLPGAAPAQEGAQETAQEAEAPSSHEQAARELFELAGGGKVAEAGAEAMLGVLRQNPELAPYEDVFREWYKKIFSGDELEREMVTIYMGAFTEQELRDLAAFYRTPLGQKTLTVLPQVMQQGAQVGMRLAQEHSGELEEMLAEARRKREQDGDPER